MKQLFFTIALWITTLFLSFGQFQLPSLQYRYSALEPYIDSTTMYIHLNNHHAAYVANLNKSLEKYPELYKRDILDLFKNIETLPAEVQTSVRNNGGGYYNHKLFWNMLAPAGTAPMSVKVKKQIEENFGSVEKFKEEFEAAGLKRFGSGWVWLIKEDTGKLKIITTANQDNTYMPFVKDKGVPVLTLDVWEHAYYLKYQSKRAAYQKAFWEVVNWKEVERLLQ